VKSGQDVVVDSPAPVDASPQPEALPLPILYQDKDLIVIDKPAGMVVTPPPGIRAGRWSTRCCTTSTISAASAARSGRASSIASIAARRG
jgi:23S rRNA-/tRNA-specific pseudouridylate synthase